MTQPLTTLPLTATETGRRAFRDGRKPIDNPHPRGSNARQLWARGYNDERERHVIARALPRITITPKQDA